MKPFQNLTDSLDVLGCYSLVQVVLRIDDDETWAQRFDKGEEFGHHHLETRPDVPDKVNENDSVHPSVGMVADRDERPVGQIRKPLRASQLVVDPKLVQECAREIRPLMFINRIVNVGQRLDGQDFS